MDPARATPSNSEAPSPPLGPLTEKVLIVAGLLLTAGLGYYAVGLAVDPTRAATLHTALDERIPFLPLAMWIYAWVYTAMFYPAFVVRDRLLFRRVGLAYLAVILSSLVCFAAWPVTSLGLRPDPSGLDLRWFHNWGLRVNYTLDPPTNLFPSLHLSSACLAALSAWRARPLWGWLAFPLVAAIALAICLVKQHYLLDGLGGLALGGVAYAALVHPARPGPAEEPASDWRGPAAYLAFHLAVFGGLYLAFLAGWEPWAGSAPPR